MFLRLFTIFNLILSLSAFAGVQEKINYKKLTLDEKTYGDDISFCLTFEPLTTMANKGGGKLGSTTFTEDLGLRGIPGFDGGNSFALKKGEKLHYSAFKNVDHKQGTISFWACAKNYHPAKTGKFHIPYIYLFFKDKNSDRWIRMFIYQFYNRPRVCFYWDNSEQPRGRKGYRVIQGLKSIKAGQDEWYMVTASWDTKGMKLYYNGKLVGSIMLPTKAAKTMDMEIDPDKSYIGIRQVFFKPYDTDSGKVTLIDDIKIYNRMLADFEIKKNYSDLVDSKEKVKLPDVGIDIQGTEAAGENTSELLSVSMDFKAMPVKWQKDLKNRKIKADYTLNGPNGYKKSGKLNITAPTLKKLFKGASCPGRYTFILNLKGTEGKTNSITKSIDRPDISFLKHTASKTNTIPPPWTPINYKNGTVDIWNRSYKFNDNMFPVEIIHSGDRLLNKAPELIVETAEGIEKIKYEITGHKKFNSYILLHGEGKGKKLEIKFTIKVEFDGFTRTDFKIYGKPKVKSMKLVWIVAPQFSDFLMVPHLKAAYKKGKFEYPFPNGDRYSSTMLWLTSIDKGFCWSPEHDANWVYKPGENVLKVNITGKGAECEVDMITKTVTIPEGTQYHAMFIATPSRPRPANTRFIRINGSRGNDPAGLGWDRDGLEEIFSFKPGKDFNEYIEAREKMGGKRAFQVIGAAVAVTRNSKEANFFRNHWELPNRSIYNMGGNKYSWKKKFWPHLKPYKVYTANYCPGSKFSDLILDSQQKLFEHKYGDRVKIIYYDLCQNYACTNKKHGCSFKDSFGRQVHKLLTVSLRNHLLRTTRLAHKYGAQTLYHDHNMFNPMIHGVGDFWWPGEHFHHEMTQYGPYAYADKLHENVYRTELNSDLLGPGVLFLPDLKRAALSFPKSDTKRRKKYLAPEATESLFAQLMVNCVQCSNLWIDAKVYKKIYNIFDKFKISKAKAFPYYRVKQKLSDNPKVRVAYYKCPNNKYLVIASTASSDTEKAVINLCSLKMGFNSIKDVYNKKTIPVKDEKVKVTVKPRNFIMLGM